jgi:hypothetical protein
MIENPYYESAEFAPQGYQSPYSNMDYGYPTQSSPAPGCSQCESPSATGGNPSDTQPPANCGTCNQKLMQNVPPPPPPAAPAEAFPNPDPTPAVTSPTFFPDVPAKTSMPDKLFDNSIQRTMWVPRQLN